MEFGSKYVYTYSDSSEEEVSEDEYGDVYAACVPEVRARARPVPVNKAGQTNELALAEINSDAKFSACAGAGQKSAKLSKPSQKVHKWMQSSSKSRLSEPVLKEDELAQSTSRPPLKPRGPVTKKWRRADTNVVAIKFDQLTAPCNMHTGDPFMCSGCQAILSHISKFTKDGDSDVWICEFCGMSSRAEVAAEEIPTQPDVTYMLEPAPVTTASGRLGKDESLVIFCVDISGSMCVSQEVPGTVRLKGNHAERFRSLNTENENQWLWGQRRDVTYVTRLQGLQAAVDNQLQELSKDHPNRRVALITFNSEVTVVGGGSEMPLTIAGEKLNNEDELIKIGSEVHLPGSISVCRDILGKKIFDLEEGGQTALGPALLVSVIIACQVPGSKVIICTDGMANVGLGSLDNLVTTDEFDAAAKFYQKVSDVARGKGVSVSVLTIEGTECKLVELGRVASQTGGQVNTVDPMKLTKEFGNILADPVIATRVTATFLVHKGLYIRHEVDKSSRVVKEVGNVTKGTEITFEYGVRRSDSKKDTDKAVGGGAVAASDAAEEEEPENVPEQPEELPFQVQINYVDLEGAKAVRVLTQTKPITKERHQAEMYMNMPILSSHALQQSSAMAIEGNYAPSRLNAYMYQRLFYRNVSDTAMLNQYQFYNARTAPLADGILNEQRREASSSGQTIAELDEEEYMESPAEADGARAEQRSLPHLTGRPSRIRSQRRMNCPDAVAHNAYMNCKSSSRRVDDDWKA